MNTWFRTEYLDELFTVSVINSKITLMGASEVLFIVCHLLFPQSSTKWSWSSTTIPYRDPIKTRREASLKITVLQCKTQMRTLYWYQILYACILIHLWYKFTCQTFQILISWNNFSSRLYIVFISTNPFIPKKPFINKA